MRHGPGRWQPLHSCAWSEKSHAAICRLTNLDKRAGGLARPHVIMALMYRFSVICVSLLVAAMASSYAQEPQVSTSSNPPAPQSQPVTTPVQPQGPKTLEDGGISIELFYWDNTLFTSLPVMKGGAASSYSNADLNYPGIVKNTPGAMLSIPAGRQNTIRVSYFRLQGRGDEASPAALNLMGTPHAQGDWLATTHKVEDMKISWDFLTYRIPAGPRKIRLKTLWEAQWVRFASNINAPYAPISTDSSGNPISNYATETKNLIFPTLGAELEQSPARHFRYELKASGFGFHIMATFGKRKATWHFATEGPSFCSARGPSISRRRHDRTSTSPIASPGRMWACDTTSAVRAGNELRQRPDLPVR